MTGKRKRVTTQRAAYSGLKRGKYVLQRSMPGTTRRVGYYGRYPPSGGELKFHDVDLDDAVVASGAAITASINLVPQGVTEVQRVGRKCSIRRIQWRYNVTLPQTVDSGTPTAGDSIRVILFKDRQANGATATTANILESDNWQSFLNLVNSGRFQILMDRVHDLNRLTLTSTQNADTFDSCTVSKSFTFYKTCNIPIEFDGATGAITEIRSNNLGVLLISSSNVCGFNSKFRLRFSDGGA